MSTIKNDQISLYCHFNKIIKELGTSFQSPALSQKHVTNVCHRPNFILIEFKGTKHKCSFHYVAIPAMTSQIFKSVDFTKTE